MKRTTQLIRLPPKGLTVEVYLTKEELAIMTSTMNAVVDAIVKRKEVVATEKIETSPPLGLRGVLRLRKRAPAPVKQAVRFAHNEPYMEALVFKQDGQNLVAYMVRQDEYDTYTIAGYISWLERRSHRLRAEEARRVIGRAQWFLEQQLPEVHELRKSPFIARDEHVR